MKKLIILYLMVFLSINAIFAVNIPGGTKLFFTPSSGWKTDNARFAAYFFGAAGDAWVSMSLIDEEADVYLAVAPVGTWTNVIFCRMTPSNTTNSWDNKWNQTDDLVYDGENNHYTRAEDVWDGAGGSWSFYDDSSAEPELYLTAPSKVFIDETITVSAISLNVISPVYTYSIKTPSSIDFVSTTIPYSPTETGVHTFKVTVAESAAPTIILAEAEVEVTVSEIPEDITVKVDVSEAGWTEVSFYYWADGVTGGFVSPTLTDDGMYAYTFSRLEAVNIVFVNSNGTWPSGSDEERLGKQTVDVAGITTSSCFLVGDATFVDGDPDWGKRTVTTISCGVPEVIISAPSYVYEDETITLSAIAVNVTSPVYTFYVTAPGAVEAVVTVMPYVPAAGLGTYTFRVGVAEAALPFIQLAEDVTEVEVKAIPEPITVTVNILNTDWTQVAFWNWGSGVDGNFVVPKMDEEGIYSYTFERMEGLGIIFVESDGITWPEDEDYDTRLGKQTVNVEGITGDACFVVAAQEFPDGDNYAKRVVEYCLLTDVPEITADNPWILNTTGKVNVLFNGEAQIDLYTIAGQLLTSEIAYGQFEYAVNTGIYIVRVNGKSYKVVVK
ncbi:MAG: T9SS type A sorting domain-containing protein [Candidatus Azobacteroides sp.]|nr:T9SS type A sorting domain-containing protein [Candidatus Azobacteroides sp.]